MSCQRCGSVCNLVNLVLNGEVALHLPGLDGLDKPIVLGFSESVCLHRLRHGVSSPFPKEN